MANKPKIISNDLDQVPKAGEGYEKTLNSPGVHEQIIKAFDDADNLSTDTNKLKEQWLSEFINDFQEAGYNNVSISENENYINFLETARVDAMKNEFPNIEHNPLETYISILPSYKEGNAFCYISIFAPYKESDEIQKVIFNGNRGMGGGQVMKTGFKGDDEMCRIRGKVGKIQQEISS